MVKVSALGFRGERSNTALPIKPDRWVWGRVCALQWVAGSSITCEFTHRAGLRTAISLHN